MFLSIEIDDGRQLLINLAKVIAIERKDDRPIVVMDWSHASAKCTIAGPWRQKMKVVNYTYEELITLLDHTVTEDTQERLRYREAKGILKEGPKTPSFQKGHWRFSEQEGL